MNDIQEINIENKIYEIRGKQVMLDSDLALLYKCANGTKTINQAVSRHIDRFPNDFYFQLNEEEYLNLKSQLGTSNFNNYGGVRKLPYVFTEEGAAMLATVLRTKVAEEINIENKIYEIRGKQVMLDSDLALLYGCANGTKTINLAVKRHINRFPERFMFRLDEEESKDIWFQIETKNKKIETRGGKYNKPYVFTEEGVAMLATVLRTKVAEEVSIRIMDAFVRMRHYIKNNEFRISSVERKVIEHDTELKLLKESFDKFEENKKVNDIYFNGQIYDAYKAVLDICNEAKKKLVIIDSYADNTILDIIKRLKVEVTIITKENNLLTKQDIEKYNRQYNNLRVVYDNTYHDRFFILDNEIIYHCGASINRIGYKTFCINLISDKKISDLLLKRLFTFTKI